MLYPGGYPQSRLEPIVHRDWNFERRNLGTRRYCNTQLIMYSNPVSCIESANK